MAEAFYDRDFPDLRKLGYEKTSDPAYYNCVAHVVGDYKKKWWPGEYHPLWSLDYWPPNIPKEETLDAFMKAFATVHPPFEPCPDGSCETGVEKIAVYVLKGVVKHAALQNEDGTWTSKLSSDEDIKHTLPGLEGPCYGRVAAYFKRTRKAPAKPITEPPPHDPRAV